MFGPHQLNNLKGNIMTNISKNIVGDLDVRIERYIKKNPGTNFSSVCIALGTSTTEKDEKQWRKVDRSLQKLRKNNVIEYNKGWRLKDIFTTIVQEALETVDHSDVSVLAYEFNEVLEYILEHVSDGEISVQELSQQFKSYWEKNNDST